jgi:isoleucyl-tRNA synthetase
LGDDLKFVFLVSDAHVVEYEPSVGGGKSGELRPRGSEIEVGIELSTGEKCERCWHYRDDIGVDPAHPTICGRCVSNLFAAGETRRVA